MIQIITYDTDKYKEYSTNIFKVSQIGKFQALDDFEMCIIDLTHLELWKYKGDSPTSLDSSKDLLTIKEALLNTQKSKILIILPQNEYFDYNYISYSHNYGRAYKYDKHIQLKDNKENVVSIISRLLYDMKSIKIAYEITNTNIDEISINADFNFLNIENSEFESVTFSNISKKVTTIKKGNVYITTLDLKEEEQIKLFIDIFCKEKEEKSQIPDWIKNICFFNDKKLNEDKEINVNQINELIKRNEDINKQLEKNFEYKSILYSTGDELVSVVLEILEDMLEYDLKDFVDEKKEDFLIKKDDVTFVGEIKGLSSAVQNKNVSQLEVHIQNYFDKLHEEGKEEKVKGLLIINHQRNKPLEERQEIHVHQKSLAVKYGSLIIETKTLLNLYEKYKLCEISKNECKNLFKENIGVLEI